MSDFVKISPYKKINGEIKKIFLETDSSVVNYHNSKSVKDKLNEIDENLLVTDTISGNNIHIDNSTEAPLMGININGKSEQTTYTGRNLLGPISIDSIESLNAVSSGVWEDNKITIHGITYTINGNGTITLNGECTSSGSLKIFGNMQFDEDVVMLGFPHDCSTTGLYVSIKITDDSQPLSSHAGNGFKETIPSGTSIDYLYIWVDEGVVINNLVLKPMLTADLDATYDDYEPYVGGIASPNPDYPQDIISVADDNELVVTTCGKNLIKPTLETTTQEAVTCTANGDGTYTLNGTATKNLLFKVLNLDLIIDTENKYFLSGSPNDNIRVYITEREIGTNTWSREFMAKSDGVQVPANKENCVYTDIVIYVPNGTVCNNDIVKPQLEIGVSKTEFEPYKEITTTISLDNPLRSLPNGVRDTIEYNADGSGKLIRRVGEVVFDGSESWVKHDAFVNTYITSISNKKMEYQSSVCTHFINIDACWGGDDIAYCDHPSLTNLYFKTNNSTLDEWTTWLAENPITVNYELATPEEIELSSLQLVQLKQLKTFDSISNIFTDDIGDLTVTYFNNTNTSEVIVKIKDKVDIIDDDLTNLTNDVDELELNAMATGIAIGDSITVDDSVDAQVVELSISGKSEQKSYTGKNLLNATLETETKNGVTCTANGDGTYTLNGTASADTAFYIIANADIETLYNSNNGKTLNIVGGISSSILILSYVASRDSEGTLSEFNAISNNKNATTFVIPSDTVTSSNVQIRITSGTILSNTIVKPMLTTDSTATYDDFEPYVGGIASPNPDYPQEINSVADSGSIEVTTCGKNLFINNPNLWVHGTAMDDDKGTMIDSDTAYPHRLRSTYDLILQPSTTYTLNRIDTNTSYTYLILLYFYQADGTYCGADNCYIHWVDISEFPFTFITPFNAERCIIVIRNSDNSNLDITELNDQIKFQLEMGDTATEYEPYIETKANLSIEPLRSLPNGTKDELVFNVDGTGKLIRRINSSILNGTEDWELANSTDYGNLIYFRTRKTPILDAINGTGSKDGCLTSPYFTDDATNVSTEGLRIHSGYNCLVLFIKKERLSTENVAGLKAWLNDNNIPINYELATPIEESLTKEQLNALLSLRTYDSTTNVMTSDTLQPTLDITYIKNTNIGKAISGYRSNLVTDTHAGLMSPEDKVLLSELDLSVIATGEINKENIIINNSANAPLSSFGITGKSEQTTINGYQLFNANGLASYEHDNFSLINNNDGSFTINAKTETMSIDIGKSYKLTHEETMKLLKKTGEYTLDCGVVTHPYFYVNLCNSTKKYFELTNRYRNIESVEITQEMLDDSEIYLTFGIYAYNTVTIVGGTIKPMFYIDGDGTWEPYVGGIASPNPDYPQTINSVADSGSIEVVSCGKNLLNNITETRTVNGVTCTYNGDGTYTLNGTATDNTIIRVSEIQLIVRENQYYTLSGSPKYEIPLYITERQISDNSWVRECFNHGSNARTISQNKESCKYAYVSVYINSGAVCDNEIIKPQLEVGTVATEFEPYQGTTTTLTIDPLRSLPNGTADTIERNADGSYKIIRRVGEVVLDGSDDEGWAQYTGYTGEDYCYQVGFSDSKAGHSTSICTHFTNIKEVWNGAYKNGMYSDHHTVLERYFISDLTTVDEFKIWLASNPITVQYELQTPTEEVISNDELLDLKTYDNITNVYSNDSLQPILNVEYYKNTNVGIACGKLESKFNNLYKTIASLTSTTNE